MSPTGSQSIKPDSRNQSKGPDSRLSEKKKIFYLCDPSLSPKILLQIAIISATSSFE